MLRQAGYARVVLLTTQTGTADEKRRPTMANIQRELKGLLKGRTKRDTVLVAFSGHGLQLTVKDREDSFFCPQDANPTDPETLLPLNWLYDELDNSGAGATQGTSDRPQMSAGTAANYTSQKYLAGRDGWNPVQP